VTEHNEPLRPTTHHPPTSSAGVLMPPSHALPQHRCQCSRGSTVAFESIDGMARVNGEAVHFVIPAPESADPRAAPTQVILGRRENLGITNQCLSRKQSLSLFVESVRKTVRKSVNRVMSCQAHSLSAQPVWCVREGRARDVFLVVWLFTNSPS
jgi:hypothetical protein